MTTAQIDPSTKQRFSRFGGRIATSSGSGTMNVQDRILPKHQSGYPQESFEVNTTSQDGSGLEAHPTLSNGRRSSVPLVSYIPVSTQLAKGTVRNSRKANATGNAGRTQLWTRAAKASSFKVRDPVRRTASAFIDSRVGQLPDSESAIAVAMGLPQGHTLAPASSPGGLTTLDSPVSKEERGTPRPAKKVQWSMDQSNPAPPTLRWSQSVDRAGFEMSGTANPDRKPSLKVSASLVASMQRRQIAFPVSSSTDITRNGQVAARADHTMMRAGNDPTTSSTEDGVETPSPKAVPAGNQPINKRGTQTVASPGLRVALPANQSSNRDQKIASIVSPRAALVSDVYDRMRIEMKAAPFPPKVGPTGNNQPGVGSKREVYIKLLEGLDRAGRLEEVMEKAEGMLPIQLSCPSSSSSVSSLNSVGSDAYGASDEAGVEVDSIGKPRKKTVNRKRTCLLCKAELGRIRRLHRCQLCKGVVCASCSTARVEVEGFTDRQRACRTCIGVSPPLVTAPSPKFSKAVSSLPPLSPRQQTGQLNVASPCLNSRCLADAVGASVAGQETAVKAFVAVSNDSPVIKEVVQTHSTQDTAVTSLRNELSILPVSPPLTAEPCTWDSKLSRREEVVRSPLQPLSIAVVDSDGPPSKSHNKSLARNGKDENVAALEAMEAQMVVGDGRTVPHETLLESHPSIHTPMTEVSPYTGLPSTRRPLHAAVDTCVATNNNGRGVEGGDTNVDNVRKAAAPVQALQVGVGEEEGDDDDIIGKMRELRDGDSKLDAKIEGGGIGTHSYNGESVVEDEGERSRSAPLVQEGEPCGILNAPLTSLGTSQWNPRASSEDNDFWKEIFRKLRCCFNISSARDRILSEGDPYIPGNLNKELIPAPAQALE
ncbi:unnamed protein product [Choristocarpus tenellus]